MDIAHIDNMAGEPPGEIADHFQGTARLQQLPVPFPGSTPVVFAVHFSAGGRTKPHVHPNGQMLVITAGRGLIGTEAGPRLVTEGDVVAVQPGEWHWHGATPDDAMTHVTVQIPGPGSADWDVDERDWATTYAVPEG